MICPACNKDRGYDSREAFVKVLGKCRICYTEEQPPVKMPGGSYLLWEDVCYLLSDGSILDKEIEENEDTTPVHEGMVNRMLPHISFCQKKKKWKLTYTGADSEIHDCGAITVKRYFDTKKELLEAMGLECRYEGRWVCTKE